MSAPLAADLVLTHSLTLISLAWVAQLGTQPLAAAALAAACYTMLGRLIISGLCGALDTQAAQVPSLVQCLAGTCKSCSCELIAAPGTEMEKQTSTAGCCDSMTNACAAEGIWRRRCGVAAYYPAALGVLLPAALRAAHGAAAGHAHNPGCHRCVWCC